MSIESSWYIFINWRSKQCIFWHLLFYFFYIFLPATWFEQSAGTWYTFEPLHYKLETSVKDRDESWDLKLVSDVLKCHPEEGYYRHFQHSFPSPFHKNLRYWNACSALPGGASGCFSPELAGESCSLFPIRLAKLVKMRLRLARRLFDDPELRDDIKMCKSELTIPFPSLSKANECECN